jgi:hypothetical protein
MTDTNHSRRFAYPTPFNWSAPIGRLQYVTITLAVVVPYLALQVIAFMTAGVGGGSQGAEVTIYNDTFEINCEALSACDYSYEQIADDLLASFPIAELRPDTPDLMQIMAVGAGMGYCGPSNGGNHVCSI